MKYALGIDGGGTKTEFCLCSKGNKPIRQVQLGASNPIDLGFDAACAVLKAGIEEVLGDISPSEVTMFAGIAGGISGGMRERLADFFATFGFAAFDNGSDVQNIFAAGLKNEDGVAVIMGTGICAFVKQGETIERIGGWGYLFDNGGSGFDIGREALVHHFRVIDGRDQRGLLSELIEREYPDAQALLSHLYEGGKRAIAAFCPMVLAAAWGRDEIAEKIVKRNLDAVATLIKAAGERLSEKPIQVMIAGGLTKERNVLLGLKARLNRKYLLGTLDVDPCMGAVRLAKELGRKKGE